MTAIDSRCPLCAWAGATDDDVCPVCGHGLIDYEVTINE